MVDERPVPRRRRRRRHRWFVVERDGESFSICGDPESIDPQTLEALIAVMKAAAAAIERGELP